MDELVQLHYVVQTFLDEETLQNNFALDLLKCIMFLLEVDNDELTNAICKGKNTLRMIVNFLKSPLDEEIKTALKCVGQVLASDSNENVDCLLFEGVLDVFYNLLEPTQKE